MPALDAILQQKLLWLDTRRQKRTLKDTHRLGGVTVERGRRALVSFSCNDYLGLAQRQDMLDAAALAMRAYGVGAGASRLVTGNYPPYDTLETKLAQYKQAQAACVFGSGYLANIGTIPALVGKGDLILADKLAHACMLDAARLSGATVMRFAHNNVEHCRMLLESNRSDHQNCLVMTETVFSMDGDRAPVRALKLLAESSDSWLMTDDAHGLGVIPQADADADIRMGTLSKAAGSYGGYICGSDTLVAYLKTAARSLIYSTGLPPASVAASALALDIMAREPQLGEKALANARHFTSLLGLAEAQSAIVPLVLKESKVVLAASHWLEEQGFLVAAIRPPTVPEHTARLRFAFSALHEVSHIEALASSIRSQGWV